MNDLLNEAKASGNDQTKTTTFENDLTPAGPTFARFIGYVEVGVRPQRPYLGKPKPDCAEVRLTFELNGPKHLREIEVEGSKKKISNVISIKVTMKTTDNSGFIKLFRKMVYGRPDIKNFPSMLGEGFLITIVHNEDKDKDGKPVTYVNMRDAEFNYLIGAPAQVNPATGETVNFNIPEPLLPLRLLLWDKPSETQWKSIFIDGTRKVKRDGKEVEESKNWLQRDILTKATNYLGSPLEALLAGADGLDLPGDMGSPDAPDAPETPASKPETPSEPKEAPTPPSDDAAEAAQALFDQLGV